MTALHAARRAFTKAESSERIHRALKHKVRVSNEFFCNGDKVFFKRDDFNRCRGPGTVIGQDGKIVFIRYGEQLVRVASCRLVKINNEQYEQSTPEHHSNDDQVRNNPDVQRNVVTNSLEIEDSENATENPKTEPLIFGKETLSRHEPVSAVKAGNEISFDDDISSEIHIQPTTGTSSSNSNEVTPCKLPKAGDYIKYKLSENEDWIEAKILSRDGESTVRNKYYFNIMNNEDQFKLGIILELVDFEIIEKDNSEEVEAVFVSKERHSDTDIIETKNKDLQNWKDFGIFKEVPNQGQTSLSIRWVVTEKPLSAGQKGVKAHLVVRGFEEDDKVQADSPTASKSVL